MSLQLFSVLRSRRTLWEWVAGSRFPGKGGGTQKNTALAQWVPGHGQCHPFDPTHPAPVSTPLTSTHLFRF